ncbi:MAG: hypothetical protein Q9170_002915 [Blastenia crenularia]
MELNETDLQAWKKCISGIVGLFPHLKPGFKPSSFQEGCIRYFVYTWSIITWPVVSQANRDQNSVMNTMADLHHALEKKQQEPLSGPMHPSTRAEVKKTVNLFGPVLNLTWKIVKQPYEGSHPPGLGSLILYEEILMERLYASVARAATYSKCSLPTRMDLSD